MRLTENKLRQIIKEEVSRQEKYRDAAEDVMHAIEKNLGVVVDLDVVLSMLLDAGLGV